MWGTVTTAGGTKVVRFEREFARPPEQVWAALVTPARVADWMHADAEIDPRAGGRFHLRFHNGPHEVDGRILRFEPPLVLEYTWPEAEAGGDSVVLWRLEARPAGCRLIMTHTLLAGGDVADFRSGWHWHIDALAAALDGAPVAWDGAAWRALRERYAAGGP